MDITPGKALPWILFALTLLGYVWTASSISHKLDYLMTKDREERVFLMKIANGGFPKVSPSVAPTDAIFPPQ